MSLEIGPPPRPRLRIALGAAVVLVIVGLAAAVIAGVLAPGGAVVELTGGNAGTGPNVRGAVAVEVADDDARADELLVHVLGAVERPGVYRLRAEARVLDAIAAAGGLTEDAAPGGINLARPVVDAEQLAVPRVGEVVPAPPAAAPGVAPDGRIDLNRADTALLETLPRIGPATASRIVRWREEHGGFAVVEDLLAVSGIGQKTLDSLRDLVTV